MEEHEQVIGLMLYCGGEAENPAGGHTMDIVTRP
jgi:hypothetical protein